MTGEDDALLDLLGRPELTLLWASAQPVWLWQRAEHRVAWANAAALALWRADSLHALTRSDSTAANQPAFAQIDRLAYWLTPESTQFERLRFFRNGRDINLLCKCEWRRYGTERLLLVTAMQPVAGLAMPRDAAGHAHLLLADTEADVALLSGAGELLSAGAGWSRLMPAADDELAIQLAALARHAEAGERGGKLTAGAQTRRVETSLLPISTVERLILVRLLPPHAEAQPSGIEDLIDKLQRMQIARQALPTEVSQVKAPTNDNDEAPPAPASGKEDDEAVTWADTLPRRDGLEGAKRKAAEAPLEPEADLPDLDGGDARPAEPAPGAPKLQPITGSPNVFRLSGSAMRLVDEKAELQSNEHAAFRELARALGARLESDLDNAEPIDETGPALPAYTPAERQAETLDPALLPNAAELMAIVERVPLALLVFANGQPVFANRPLLDMFQLASLSQFLALPGISSLLPQIDSDTGHHPARLVARRPNGEIFHVIARLKAISWNEETAMLLTMREVERDAAEDAAAIAAAPLEAAAEDERARLRQQVTELTGAIALVADAVIMLDMHGIVTSIDESGAALLGNAAAGLVGQPFADLFSAATKAQVSDYIDGLDRHGVSRVHGGGRDVVLTRRGESDLPVRLKLGLTGSGDTRRFCAVLQDISQWKHTEQEMKRARIEAEQASNQKSEFLAKVSHEIRTPLNSIIGFSELMIEEHFAGVDNERYRTYMRDIHESGRLLLGVVNDLLDLSKIEAGKLELDFSSVDVNESVARAVASMQPEATRSKIVLRSSYAGSLPKVVADQRSLQQILLNLLSNAIKFTEAGGQVIVSTGLTDRGEVQIRVRDTGSGMDKDQLQAALEPFRQIPRALPTRVPGTGLGLPLTKAFAEANRALFDIDSTPGVGTLAQITFPPPRVLGE